MRLLFIKLKHIGDALILTPTLQAVRQSYPDAQIWVVLRKGTEGILHGCDAVDRICTASAAEAGQRGRWDWLAGLRLLGELRRTKFDYAFELGDGDRGRGLAVLSGARERVANAQAARFPAVWKNRFTHLSDFQWHMRHQVEKDFYTVQAALPLPGKPGPLVFSSPGGSLPIQPQGEFAVIHPATRWERKKWPLEHWIQLCHELRAYFDSILVSCGPQPVERGTAAAIVQGAPPGVISTEGQLSWTDLATLLRGAGLFVGVDTAAMHLAAACQTPTVALFGPSNEFQWSPWQVLHRIVFPPAPVLSPEDPAFLGKLDSRKTADIRVEDVVGAARNLLQETRGKAMV